MAPANITTEMENDWLSHFDICGVSGGLELEGIVERNDNSYSNEITKTKTRTAIYQILNIENELYVVHGYCVAAIERVLSG